MCWSLDSLDSIVAWRPASAPPGAVIGATTRLGGVSEPPYDSLNLGRSTPDRLEAVTENRRRVLAALELEPGRVAVAGQVHGAQVTSAHAPGLYPETDALVTREAGLGLAVSGADCMPILYAARGAVAAAHAGWRGTVAGIPVRALQAVVAASTGSPADVLVYFGPCIGPCCYVVRDDVASRFPHESLHRREGLIHLDLARAARLQLEAAGVPPAAIVDPPACTSCHPEWCYSHRRDRGATGRHWGLISRVA